MPDKIDASAGDEAENLNIGKRNTQNTQRAGDNYFGAPAAGNELMQVWIRLSEHGQQIQELIRQMDNLPGRVRDLEKTEVIIRPRTDAEPEIIYRPAPNVTSLSMRTLMIVLVTALVIVIALVAFLVYWTVRNG